MNTSEANVILKYSVVTDWTSGQPVPKPEILLLANREGFRELSSVFLELADRAAGEQPEANDPDDHMHLETRFPPFDSELSDECEIRLGSLSEQNIQSVCAKYSISPATKRTGSLIDQFSDLIATANDILNTNS